MGFGASMEIIYTFPTVADLLISMAAAAASNPNSQHRQRFFACPNPPSDFVSEDLRHNNSNNPDDNMGIKWQELQQVCIALLHNSCFCICVAAHRQTWSPHGQDCCTLHLQRMLMGCCNGGLVDMHSDFKPYSLLQLVPCCMIHMLFAPVFMLLLFLSARYGPDPV